MSREIKFRAWRLDGGMYKPFDLTNLVSDEYAGESWLDCGDGLHIDHRTGWDSLKIMQYTGLKDKNGKEIFEGDIVRLNSVNYEIIYRRYHACFMLQHKDYSGEVFCHFFHEKGVGNWKNTEIIGNIYENKELITGVKNG